MEDLAPGVRFYPTEEELISFYLRKKLDGSGEDLTRVMNRIIPVVNIYEFNPWDLPQVSGEICHRDPEQWFFFIPRQESEARGGRPRRLTTTGYWKATGSPSFVYATSPSCVIGVKRTMVFYTGRAPRGKKTEWKMNEYKALQAPHADRNDPPLQSASSSTGAPTPTLRQEFSLCRVYKKSKCLRAFDRRPLGADVITSNTNPRLNVESVGVYHQGGDLDNLMRERANFSSPESSSSGDHAGTQPSGESSGTVPMAVDNEIFWDLEQLNNLWLN